MAEAKPVSGRHETRNTGSAKGDLGVIAVAFLAAAPLAAQVLSRSRDSSRSLPESRGAKTRHGIFPPLGEWISIFKETYAVSGTKEVGLLAAGVSFYALFAIFPALGAATWIFGLAADPASIREQLSGLREVLPEEAWKLIEQQLEALTTNQTAGMSIAGIVGLATALYTARLAASSMMQALNVVYDVEETRSFVETNAIAFLFTVVAIVVLLMAVGALVVVPAMLGISSSAGGVAEFMRYLRWPALTLLMIFALAVTYRYGPNRRNAHWRWITAGSLLATVLWLVASIGFSWYVAAFNSYDKVYGSLGAVVILLFWFWLTAYSGLLGACLDKVSEDRLTVSGS